MNMQDIKIFNATPHPIVVIDGAIFRDDIRKFVVPDGVAPTVVGTIPSHGVLSAKIDTVLKGTVNGIPVYEKTITGADPLPPGYDIYIVSALYASALRMLGADMSKVYTVADPVYSWDGKTILGCRGICPAF